MFYGASSFKDLAAWNVSKVSSMGGMFLYAYYFDQELSSWNTSSVEDLGYMLYGVSSFNKDLAEWDESLKVSSMGKYSSKHLLLIKTCALGATGFQQTQVFFNVICNVMSNLRQPSSFRELILLFSQFGQFVAITTLRVLSSLRLRSFCPCQARFFLACRLFFGNRP
jgi:hypothetical protein